MDFSQDQVWKLLMQFTLLFVAMLVGNMIRRQIPFIRKFYIPSALIGGVLLLAFKQIPAVAAFIDDETMQMVTYHCLGLGFAAMAIKTPKEKRKVPTVKIVESGAIMAGSYLLQAILGLGISIAFYFLAKSFYAAGLILPMGFGQSTGSALSWGSKYELNFGFAGGASYGLAVASIGFLVGSIVGVIALNHNIRKGRVRPRRQNTEEVEVLSEKNEIPNSESVDKLSIQFCFVALAYGLSYGFMKLLALTGVKAIGDLAWGLNFLWGLLFGFLIRLTVQTLNKRKIINHNYVSNHLMDRISGFCFDLMIVAGVTAIDFEDIRKNWLLLLVTCTLGTLVTFFYVKKATRHAYPGYEVEGFVTNFGTVTGTVSTGMILLREIDPNFVTPAASNIVLQNIPSLVMLAPLLLTMGFAASSLTHTLIMLGVYVVLFVAYNIFLFRRKLFHKKPEEPWSNEP